MRQNYALTTYSVKMRQNKLYVLSRPKNQRFTSNL